MIETGYTFNPATKTITVPKYIARERLVLITNVTKNQVIYNFSDPALRATSYSANIDAAMLETTTIVLNYNTAAMSSTDKLQITVDELAEAFMPDETLLDPTNKFRVTTPQALIDTDFEYSTQITKWENIGLVNNRPFSYQSPTQLLNVSSITMNSGSRTVTIVLSSGNAPANGTSIAILDTFLSIANGNFVIESGGGTNTFTYSAKATNNTSITSLLDTNKTAIFLGTFYTGAQIGTAPTITYSGTEITVTTTIPHGLSIGNEISVTGTTASTNAPNGSYTVARITGPSSFRYFAAAAPTGTLVSTGSALYVRPQAQFLHRPFDGGVIFSSNGDSNFETAVRQTRRYFRYQSGKGIQISSGTILKPNLQVDSITASGTVIGATVTVQTKEQHNIQPGTSVTVSGCTDSAYNGTFTINSITGFNTFTYTTVAAPTTTIAGGTYNIGINQWFGARNRLGAFDQQNGLFFEFDGTTLYAVRRNSTFQMSGKVTVTNGSNTVVQTNASFPTYFAKQLRIGDYIVLRGQSYRVTNIASDTSMTISPSYRGATAQFVVASKTQDVKIPQSQWNIDKADGTGTSGYNIDLTKMQMFYIDYTWYGAGFVRWGMRGAKGNVTYLHKMPNNNVNNEAYMRSGNLPGRYESQTEPYTTQITTTIGTGDTIIYVDSTDGFPASGTLCVRDGSKNEYVNYTGKTSTTFTGVTREAAGVASLALTIASGSNTATVGSATGLQVGQRIISSSIPEGTFIAAISGTTLTLSKAATAANPTVIVPPMGAGSAQAFTYSATAPVAVEYAWPTYAPAISHWGTSVIMDGRYDEDKSLVFTYGQTTTTAVAAGQTRALLSIRVAPSVDNGLPAPFGGRELINRMQLVLKSLDFTAVGATSSSFLVRAILNGTPSSATAWTNAVGGNTTVVNSSLAQIADYSGGTTTVVGGEVTAGFFTSGTTSIDLSDVRDLGNAVMGGGTSTANSGIYPDGPDVLTITVTNVGAAAGTVLTRLSWTEAQA